MSERLIVALHENRDRACFVQRDTGRRRAWPRRPGGPAYKQELSMSWPGQATIKIPITLLQRLADTVGYAV
ncbi:MAG: hypothetical protein ACJ8AI_19720 [Rhodopila sp.]